MSGDFFNVLQSSEVKSALEFLNSILERESYKTSVFISELSQLTEQLEEIGLHTLAIEYIEKVPEERRPDILISRYEHLKKKSDAKGEDLKVNWRNNLEALKKVMPNLQSAAMNAGRGEVYIAGDSAKKFRLLKRSKTRYQDVTLSTSDLNELKKELELKTVRIRRRGAVIVSDLLNLDVIMDMHGIVGDVAHRRGLTVYVVEPDIHVFNAVLHVCDISEAITNSQLVFFAGRDFAEQMKKWFTDNPEMPVPCIAVMSESVRRKTKDCLYDIVENRDEDL